jgi:hypothetical protein
MPPVVKAGTGELAPQFPGTAGHRRIIRPKTAPQAAKLDGRPLFRHHPLVVFLIFSARPFAGILPAPTPFLLMRGHFNEQFYKQGQ